MKWTNLQIALGGGLCLAGLLQLGLQSLQLPHLLPQLGGVTCFGGPLVTPAAVQQPLVLCLKALYLW